MTSRLTSCLFHMIKLHQFCRSQNVSFMSRLDLTLHLSVQRLFPNTSEQVFLLKGVIGIVPFFDRHQLIYRQHYKIFTCIKYPQCIAEGIPYSAQGPFVFHFSYSRLKTKNELVFSFSYFTFEKINSWFVRKFENGIHTYQQHTNILYIQLQEHQP